MTDAQPVKAQTAVSGRVPWLDGWRGLAIITVLAGHFGGIGWPAATELGGYGVELFFVLSGQLMAHILFIDRHPLPDFFRRRFARIYPALLVYVLVFVAADLAALALHRKPLTAVWDVVGALTFTINYLMAFTGMTSLGFAHIWSVSVEEHCYALLALLVRRRVRVACWLIGAIGCLALVNGARLWLGAGPNPSVHDIFWRSDVRLAPVFISAALCLVLNRYPPGAFLRRILGLWAPLSIVVGAALSFSDDILMRYTLTAPMLALGLNGLAYAPEAFRRSLSLPWLTGIGLRSYSLYLWQQPFYRVAGHTPKLAPLMILGLLVVWLMSYRFIETPARRWINGLGARGAGRAEPVAA